MFTDIHTHILPIDDGASTFEEAIDMIKQGISQNVKTFILTPHYNHPKKTKLDKCQIVKSFEFFKQTVLNNHLNCILLLGAEIFYQENFSNLVKTGNLLTFNDTDYILLEFDFTKKQDFEEIIFVCKHYKLKPIIAHPERYSYINTIKDILYLKQLGFLLQINSSSFDKKFRKYKLAHKIVNNKLADFIASDCHNTSSRKIDLQTVYTKLLNQSNKNYLEKVFFENPKILTS